ncbi:unnamed protein product [Durusdinium trenchii]|uniref:Aspergillus nuclease S(1) n=2 Tax=Durusdinium trenchii TaxID=1381693 RepID=A0ABP0LME4_9DINO
MTRHWLHGATLLLFTIPPVAWAWWDNGHMLTAEIARQQLTKSQVAVINGLLEEWSDDFPGLCDLVTAAVWPDQLKCANHGAVCPRAVMENIHIFDPWHFDEKPYNPQNLTLPHCADQWLPNPSASFTLTSAITSMGTSNSRFAFNFMLRWVIHLVGDIHQPLHSADGYFDDARLGHLPQGDRGGNLIPVISDCGANNLHFYWDSAACQYLVNWSPHYQDHREALTQNASDLITKYPPSSFGTRYDPEHLKACWTQLQNKSKPSGVFDICQQVFVRWVNDTFDTGVPGAYGGITRNSMIPDDYAVWAKEMSRRQIVLGGYRLGDMLRLLAEQGARVKQVPDRKPHMDLNTKIFMASTIVLAVLLVLLLIRYCKLSRRLRDITSPNDMALELNRAVA